MKKIITNFSANTDGKNLKLAFTVCKNSKKNKLFEVGKLIFDELHTAACELNDAKMAKFSGYPGNKRVETTRKKLWFQLDYAVAFVQFTAFQHPEKGDKIISDSGFITRQKTLRLYPEFSVTKGKEAMSARVKIKAVKAKAIYIFRISKDGKEWNQELSTSSFYTFKNLAIGHYFFSAAVVTKKETSEFTEAILFAVN